MQQPVDLDQVVGRVRSMLLEVAPAGWESIDLTVLATVIVYEVAGEVRLADGRSVGLELPEGIAREYQQIRKSMYQPDRGTWFSASLTLHRSAEPQVVFNFDDPPLWVPPLPTGTFSRDLAVYPRSPEHIPQWLADAVMDADAEETVTDR